MLLQYLFKNRGSGYGEIIDIKKDVEAVLGRLGVLMSTAVDMFLNQIVLTGGIPFAVTLQSALENIDTTKTI